MRFLLSCAAPVVCLALAAAAQTGAPGADAAKSKPGAAAKSASAAAAKSALDKSTLEFYIRHANRWGKQIQLTIADPKPSAVLPGFHDVVVQAGDGTRNATLVYQVSNDGSRIVRGEVFNVNENPFRSNLAKLKTQLEPSLGTAGAPVVLVVFSDFQCGYCKEEGKMLRQNLLSAYPKQVRLYFKDLPIEQIHPWAKPAAIAGRCVFRSNPAAFWDYHDWVFENQESITPENFRGKLLEFATAKNLDTLQLSSCFDGKATQSEVDRNLAEARELQVFSTPTLFVNGRRVEGQIGWPDLRNIIDIEIEYQKTAKNAGEDCGCDLTLPVGGK